MISGVILMVGAVCAGDGRSARAAPPGRSGAVTISESTGTLGPYRIGLSLRIGDGRSVIGGHYFYAAHLVDIPLAGGCNDGMLILTEPGGGRFRLHLTGAGSTGGCTALDNATGWAGDWTQGGRSLPVQLANEWQDADQPGRFYQDVTGDSDAAFESKVQRFIAAVLAGNSEAASSFVSYPLKVNTGGRPRMIGTPESLVAEWRSIFTPVVLDALRGAMPHDMFRQDGMAMLGNGVVWFDGKGAATVNQNMK